MLFNSVEFLVFLPIVFSIYWSLKNYLNIQNSLILASSYVFYGWWDYRFLGLIALSTLVDYTVGLKIEASASKSSSKIWLLVSLFFNIGLLAYFKYSNFFIDNLLTGLRGLGLETNWSMISIILPVGISFYTFQTLSYSIDVYRKNLTPTRDFIAFASFVSFFPQLVAGPIERASNLLPQFGKRRVFNSKDSITAINQVLYGLFKKVVIADNSAEFADLVFSNPEKYGGGSLLIGAVFFSFQIYGDFSGYSDMAIGIARLFGFDLKRNFAYPYFSRSIPEFWRRWHISLSTWFRDYVYIPLGGSRHSKKQGVRNVFLIFILSGFWHGANWTFVVWGFLNALYFLPSFILEKNRVYSNSIIGQNGALPTFNEVGKILFTFILTVLAWIFFRASSVSEALYMIEKIVNDLGNTDVVKYMLSNESIIAIPMILIMLWIDYMFREKEFPVFDNKLKNSLFVLTMMIAIFFFGAPEAKFIYFDF